MCWVVSCSTFDPFRPADEMYLGWADVWSCLLHCFDAALLVVPSLHCVLPAFVLKCEQQRRDNVLRSLTTIRSPSASYLGVKQTQTDDIRDGTGLESF